ncbi:myogenesis-regulating glycosidase-like [Schistocerca piceifrons]|uniref:myogenesis-regulating glycosidase-like n=1 Tax=Schistocerca piceifrons TaxID=274613 RepID=UPI001F5F5B4B|nr:myogenesis-regulating glycosidase-like [Schistocerca piceifrons]
MEWDVCSFDNAREAHEYAVGKYLSKPTAIPDERMATHPIWSTWVRYKKDVDDEKVRQLAAEIVANGFNNSHIQVDDNWETCYGSLTFDANKFPDVRALTDDLRQLGFRSTLWIHPFVSEDCEPYHSEALSKGYFATNTEGSTRTECWRGYGGVIDFTNSKAADQSHLAWRATALLVAWAVVCPAAAELRTRYDEDSGRLLVLSATGEAPSCRPHREKMDRRDPKNNPSSIKVSCSAANRIMYYMSTFQRDEEFEIGYFVVSDKDGSSIPCGESRSNKEHSRASSCKITVENGDSDGHCLNIQASIDSSMSVISSCLYHLDSQVYGGHETINPKWPMESKEYDHMPYVTVKTDHIGIAVRYWLFSDGRLVHIPSYVPLFISQNTNDSVNSLCFIAENKDPYPLERADNVMEWDVCSFDDAREAHEYAVGKYLAKPTAIPDERMATHPIWSTWVRYKKDVNDEKVRQLAAEILANGFNNSHIQVDDNWETCYGSLTFDTNKFPDVRALTDDLRQMGFRSTLWIHPFVSEDCEPYHSEALSKGYFATNTEGSTRTEWWRGYGGVIDFTNSKAASWWINRVWALRNETGLDSFKFDAGETSWLPQLPAITPLEVNPVRFTDDYVQTVSQFGPMIEVRASVESQHLPHFFRMIDKDSSWSAQNGLKTLIPTLLQMNIVGHPFVLPDMVGGNGYKGDVLDKQLFIRWLQVNVFMPTIQLSSVPWDYDNETVEIFRNMTALHTMHAPRIVEAMERAVKDGTPVNPPIWWLDPTDSTALTIDSEFLLGKDLLAAPIVQHDTYERDVYLPKGSWLDEVDPEHPTIEGPTWLRDYPAPLNTLPHFTRVTSS